jgi:hypothetical protein
MAFIPEYKPDEDFREWVGQAEARVIKEICGQESGS